MRKVIVLEHISLDGVIQAPGVPTTFLAVYVDWLCSRVYHRSKPGPPTGRFEKSWL
jgi:hypothetical protein